MIPQLSSAHSLPMSTPITSGNYNAIISKFGTRYGYVTRPDKYFGSTEARMSYSKDSNNAVATNTMFDASRHLTIHADHSAQVAWNSYVSNNQYQSSIPANILQSGMNHAIAKHLLENAQKNPLCQEEGRFIEQWEKLLEPLLPTEELLTKYASSPKKFGECECPVSGCPFVDQYEEDLYNHVKKVHPLKTKEKHTDTEIQLLAICPSFQDNHSTSLGNYIHNHLKPTCKKSTQMRIPYYLIKLLMMIVTKVCPHRLVLFVAGMKSVFFEALCLLLVFW